MIDTKKSFPISILPLLVGFFFIGCKKADNIMIAPPKAAFSYTAENPVPALVNFTNNSNIANPADVNFTWNFGDGNTISIPGDINPTHVYTATGIYQVTLCTTGLPVNDTLTKVLGINERISGLSHKPGNITTIDFSFVVPVNFGINFSNFSTHANSYIWEFGDGAISRSDSFNVYHQYTHPGPFTVKLSATGPESADTASAIIKF